jgi:hypothetical protein
MFFSWFEAHVARASLCRARHCRRAGMNEPTSGTAKDVPPPRADVARLAARRPYRRIELERCVSARI